MVEILLGFVVLVYKEGMALGVFSKVLLELLFLCSSERIERALKVATEVGQDVLEGKDVIKSAKSRGKQAVSDRAEAATNKVMVGCGRKKGIKRATPGKTVIRAPTEKLKTCNKLDNYNPKWNGSMIRIAVRVQSLNLISFLFHPLR